MKKLLFFIITLLSFNYSFANVGGRFYKYGIAGIVPDDSTTILQAITSISCSDSICMFETVYKTSSSNSLFKGRFFGLNFANIKINNKPFSVDSSQIKILQGDSAIFNRNWVLENFTGQNKYKSIKIEAIIKADSTFTISGNLIVKPAHNWGLAVLQDMASLRHPFMGNINPTANEYSIVYLFAPIQSFARLQSVSLAFQGKNIFLKKRLLHFNKSYKNHPFRNITQNDYISFTDSIPEAVEYRFSKDDSLLMRRYNYFSLGGPVAYLGKKSGKFFYELGWEFAINPFQLISILPSVNYSVGPNDSYWDYGLRLLFTCYSAGILYNEKKELDYSIGISMGVLGIEFRSKRLLLQLSF